MNTIEQRKDGWYWWNETWTEDYGPYPAYRDALTAQRRYVDEVLDANNAWQPTIGEYVWWTPRSDLSHEHGSVRRPVKVVADAPSNHDWLVWTMMGAGVWYGVDIPVDAYEIKPMSEMEFIALASTYPEMTL
jgi:hypothetical protein